MLRRDFLWLCLVLACTKKSAKLQIAVIPKGTSHEFWKSVHAGTIKAARELGNVDILWKGPLQENDLKGQIDVVDGFVAQGVSGILLAPLDDTGLVAPVKQAALAKIPVVIFDSDLKGEDHLSFVATDNFEAGKLAAEAMGKLLDKDHGKVIVLRYQEGSASTQKREAGFLEAIRRSPGSRSSATTSTRERRSRAPRRPARASSARSPRTASFAPTNRARSGCSWRSAGSSSPAR